MVSKLDWPLMPEYSFGFSVSAEFAGGFRADTRAYSSLALPSGTMIDRDYLNPTESYQTRQSNHDGSIENGMDAEIRLGWVLGKQQISFFPEGLTLEPWFSFRYIVHKWLAKDGYLQYTDDTVEWTENIAKEYVYGSQLMYDQRFYLPSLGISARYPLAGQWEIEAAIGASPFIYATGYDNHLNWMKPIDYFDEMRSFIQLDGENWVAWYISPELSFSRGITDEIALRAEISGTFVNGLRGVTTLRYNTSGETIKLTNNTAGTDMNAGRLSLSLETRLR